MALNQEEQEILNKLKAYARSYGLPVGLGVFLALSSTVGWNLYQDSRAANLEQAGYTYQRFLQLNDRYNEAAAEVEIGLLNEPTFDPAPPVAPTAGEFNISAPPPVSPAETEEFLRFNLAEIADVLREDHPSSTYASFATLRVAALDLMNNNVTNAVDLLTWVVQKSPSTETTRIAGVMLGRALADQGQFQEALTLLNSNKLRNLETAASAELLGDIHYGMQEHEKALASYRQALELGANKDIINYKISLLPINVTPVTN